MVDEGGKGVSFEPTEHDGGGGEGKEGAGGEGGGEDEEKGSSGREQTFFYLHEGHTQGPVPMSHIAHWVDNGHFTLDLMVKSAADPNAKFVALVDVAPDDE